MFNDNGKGFDISKTEGFGLKSIRIRINKFNGSFDIKSGNDGSIFNISIPINHNEFV